MTRAGNDHPRHAWTIRESARREPMPREGAVQRDNRKRRKLRVAHDLPATARTSSNRSSRPTAGAFAPAAARADEGRLDIPPILCDQSRVPTSNDLFDAICGGRCLDHPDGYSSSASSGHTAVYVLSGFLQSGTPADRREAGLGRHRPHPDHACGAIHDRLAVTAARTLQVTTRSSRMEPGVPWPGA